MRQRGLYSTGAARPAGRSTAAVAMLLVIALPLMVSMVAALSLFLAPAVLASNPSSLSTVGTHFWVAFPAQIDAGGSDLTLSMVSTQTGSVTVSAGAGPGGAPQTAALAPGAVTTVAVDSSWSVDGSDTTAAKGVEVVASVPISLYAVNHQSYITSGWVVTPTPALGTRYRVMGYQVGSTEAGSQLTVVATQNATQVTVTPHTDLDNHAAGGPFVVTLQQGQTYQLRTSTVGGDITGTTVSAYLPVAVMGGNQCAFIPDGPGSCDQVEQQMVPVNAWGKHFATVRYAVRTKGDTYRILADQADTVVTVGGTAVATLAGGEYYQAVLPAGLSAAGSEGVQIDASKPVAVAQFGNASGFDSSTTDSLMAIVPPIDSFLDSYAVAVPQVANGESDPGNFVPHANLVVPTADVGAVLLDGTAVAAQQFSPISSTGYSGAQVTLDPGAHVASGPHGFGLQIYEWGVNDGFGYPAGFLVLPPTGAAVPGAPRAVGASADAGAAEVSWEPPTSNGGSSITSYLVQAYSGGVLVPGRTCTAAGPGAELVVCRVAGLSNGTPYTFTVTASNLAGSGAPSDASVEVTPGTVPSAPGSVTAVAADHQATVGWAPPADDGGSPVTSYRVQARAGGKAVTGGTCSVTDPFPNPLRCIVTGLLDGTPYTFAVTAANDNGAGPESTSSPVVVPRAVTVPGSPVAITAVAGHGDVDIAWDAPTSNGGAAITGYTVRVFEGGAAVGTCALTAPIRPPLHCLVSPLVNGRSYTASVSAVNRIGSGPEGFAPATFTPLAPPSAPSDVTALPADGSAVVSWSAPDDDGGSPILSYAAQALFGGTAVPGRVCTVALPLRPPLVCRIEGLDNRRAYTILVTATNAVGIGPASQVSPEVTPIAPPGVMPPLLPRAEPAGTVGEHYAGSVRVVNGEEPATYELIAGRLPVGVALNTQSGLLSGTPVETGRFRFAVRATNAGGTMARTYLISVVGPPSAPRALRASAQDLGLDLGFVVPASDGGSPIRSYQVSVDPAHQMWRTIRVTGNGRSLRAGLGALTNDRQYRISVRAVNAVGTGPRAAIIAIPGWFRDQISPADRRTEARIPADATGYRGPLVFTQALHSTSNGRTVVDPGFANGRHVNPGQGIVLAGNALFDFDSAVLTPVATGELNTVVRSVRGNHAIRCEGYADYSGSIPHEIALSDARAHVVCQYVASHGARVHTSTAAYGPHRPVIIGGTPTDRALNRRVAITVTS